MNMLNRVFIPHAWCVRNVYTSWALVCVTRAACYIFKSKAYQNAADEIAARCSCSQMVQRAIRAYRGREGGGRPKVAWRRIIKVDVTFQRNVSGKFCRKSRNVFPSPFPPVGIPPRDNARWYHLESLDFYTRRRKETHLGVHFPRK